MSDKFSFSLTKYSRLSDLMSERFFYLLHSLVYLSGFSSWTKDSYLGVHINKHYYCLFFNYYTCLVLVSFKKYSQEIFDEVTYKKIYVIKADRKTYVLWTITLKLIKLAIKFSWAIIFYPGAIFFKFQSRISANVKSEI